MNSRLEQLLQLVKVTWDGDLISKSERDCLVKECLATKCRGFNLLTDEGVRILYQLGLIKEETRLAAEQGEGQFTASNSDYAAALRGISDYRSSEGDAGGSIDHLKAWLQSRLNSAKAPNCA